MIIVFKHIIPSHYTSIAIWPFIFIKNKHLKNDTNLINHEKIHLKQQIELFWIFFFIWYIIEYLILLIKYKNHHTAYRSISFEKEAYSNQHNLNYLKHKKAYTFLKYL